jgi:DNA-binding NarL/FixJ family response regulator
LQAGASAYIAKDSDPGQLIQAVRNAIAGRRYVSPALGERLAAYHGQDMSPAPLDILSDREFEVLRMIAAGKTTTTIADELSLSVKTISTYRSRILAKLQLKSTPELMRYAVDQGLDR